jgi:hypothetical protein
LLCWSDRLFFATRHKKYLYAERFRKIKFPKQFYIDLLGEYEKTESINQTLDILLGRYSKGRVAKRICASKDYLKHSHYRDYETALYRYLSDNDTNHVITEILLKDMQKVRRLPCKENTDLEKENIKWVEVTGKQN